MTSDLHTVLVVTKDNKISSQVSAMLVAPLFDTQIVSDFNEARRICSERNFNIILVDFADGEGTDFAIDISDSKSTTLLLTPTQFFEQISYKVEGYGILTITSPFDQFYFYNMIKVAIAVQYNRAKMLLMQNLNMTEADAHRYIEKEAMDRCIKKTAVAEQVISTYG